MNEEYCVVRSVSIEAPVSLVWEGLTNPELTKKYYFESEAISDWKVGSSLVFKMPVDGKMVVAIKGVVLANQENSLLEHSCFSPEDENTPERHTKVTYRLTSSGGGTKLSLCQGEFRNEKARTHNQESWDKILQGLKSTVEARADEKSLP